MSTLLSRRRFLRDGLLLTGGVLAGSTFEWSRSARRDEALADQPRGNPEQRLRELELELPPPPRPAATLVPAVRAGDLLFVSGHVPRDAEGNIVVGKVGRTMDVEQAADAARQIALTVLSVVRNELGSLDRVVRVVKVLGMVNCTPDFHQTPQVINGFSQVLIDVFGEETGKGARSAVGMAALPGGAAVEVEAIFQVAGRMR